MSAVKFSGKVMQNANKFVQKCMGTEDSFCRSNCPMNTDVKAYVGFIAEKKYKEALMVIRETLFLPNTLGRVCAHPCENACRRTKEFEQPMAISSLKRFAAEQADCEELWNVTTAENTGKKVAIIGSGPAGAQAAIDLQKAGHEVTVFEKRQQTGGMLRNGIPLYRLPREILDYEYGYLKRLGVKFQMGITIGEDLTFQELRESYDAVLIAVGAQRGNVIPVPGNDAKGVFAAVDFLEEVNRTRQFPAAGRKILVVGGGDVAMDCARSALRLEGEREVMQCSLESLAELPASLGEKDGAVEEGVQCNFGWGPVEILEEKGNVKEVRIQQVTSVFDQNGRFSPTYGEETKIVEADTVILAAGQLVEDVTDGKLVQIGGGRYQADPETLETELDGVFVAGDAAGGKIIVEAMALGRKAAISMDRYLKGTDLREGRCLEKEWKHETKLNVPLPEGTEDIQRISVRMRNPEERRKDFEPVDMGFTEEDAVAEAGRCLQCGCRLCIKECTMMEHYTCCPGEFWEPLTKGKTVDTLTVYSCNDCDSCSGVCPQELPIRETFMEARKDIVKGNYGDSPLKGHRAVKVHQTLGFDSMYTTKVKGGTSHA